MSFSSKQKVLFIFLLLFFALLCHRIAKQFHAHHFKSKCFFFPFLLLNIIICFYSIFFSCRFTVIVYKTKKKILRSHYFSISFSFSPITTLPYFKLLKFKNLYFYRFLLLHFPFNCLSRNEEEKKKTEEKVLKINRKNLSLNVFSFRNQ